MPARMGVERNQRADETAKEAMEKDSRRRYHEEFASLAHVRRTISKRKWNEAKHWFKTKNDRRPLLQRARFVTALKSQDQDTAAMKKAAYVSRRYFQLMSGHDVMEAYHYLIGKIKTNHS